MPVISGPISVEENPEFVVDELLRFLDRVLQQRRN